MNTRKSRRQVIKYASFIGAVLSILLAFACSDGGGGGNKFVETVEPDIGLTGCADDDSCFSNPTLEIGGDRLAQVFIPSDYNTATRYSRPN